MSENNEDASSANELPLDWMSSESERTIPASWNSITRLLKERVGSHMYDRWFSRMGLQQMDESRVVLSVPNAMHQYWIEDNYAPVLTTTVNEVLGSPRSIEFFVNAAAVKEEQDEVVLSPRAALPAKRDFVTAPANDEKRVPKALIDSCLNSRLSFANFVVGPNCSYSQAVARAVAEKPGKVYNPLFLHGAAGLGKTHLMHAIGLEILRLKPRKIVRYVNSENFTNEFIDAIRKNTTSAFRVKYRKVDVLLIDDIHFLAGKDSTQEEFFHTFNELFHSFKQIVLASDRAPSEIRNLETRLVSRFEWGMAAQLETPDLETRTAILKQKVQECDVQMEDWVLQFIASRVRTNVRRLEGALVRVAAHISLDGTPLTEQMIEGMIKDLVDDAAGKSITIDVIQKVVADHFDVRLSDMTSRRRPKAIAQPRQIAMYLAREFTKSSLKDISEAFGKKDHGTVIHACKTINGLMDAGDDFRRVVMGLTEKLKRL